MMVPGILWLRSYALRSLRDRAEELLHANVTPAYTR